MYEASGDQSGELGVEREGDDEFEPIMHSNRFMLVDTQLRFAELMTEPIPPRSIA